MPNVIILKQCAECTSAEIFGVWQHKTGSTAHPKSDSACFVIVTKYVFYMILILHSKHNQVVREPSGWALARRDWAVGGRICRPLCYVIEASVPLIWISGTDAPVLVSIWYDFVSVGPRFALFRDLRCRLCLDTYFCDCSEISKFWLHTLSVNAVWYTDKRILVQWLAGVFARYGAGSNEILSIAYHSGELCQIYYQRVHWTSKGLHIKMLYYYLTHCTRPDL